MTASGLQAVIASRVIGRIRSVGTGLSSQLASASTNLIAFALISSSSTLDSFGRAGLAGAIFLLGALVARGFVGEFALIGRAGADSRYLSGALVVGVIEAAVLLGAIAMLTAEARQLAAISALCLPGLCLFDSLRYLYFSEGRPARSLRLDLSWMVLAIGSMLVLLATGAASTPVLFGAWALAPSMVAVADLLQRRVRLGARAGMSWLRGVSPDAWFYVLDGIASAGAAQIVLLFSLMVVGIEGSGIIRLLFLVLGPIGIAFSGLYPIVLPWLRRRVSSQSGPILLWCICVSCVLLASALLWIALIVSISADVLAGVLGSNWASAQEYVVVAGVAYAGGAFGAGALVGLRSLLKQRSVVVVRLAFLPISVLLALVGGHYLGTVGFLAGWGISQWSQMLVLWINLWRFDRLSA